MLSGDEILKEVENGNIIIEPFNQVLINPNSYNMTLGDELLSYTEDTLDCKKDNPYKTLKIPKDGLILSPGVLYIAKTNEYTESPKYVPQLDGRSSIGRVGLSVHTCAGFGSIGYKGTWSLGITCIVPTKIYPNMELCQISFFPIVGEVGKRYKGKYQNKQNATVSRSHKDFEK